MTELKNNNFADVVLNRHSVRAYLDTPIPREELKEMVKEAGLAPSADNLQSWKYVVVDTPEGKENMKKLFMPFNLLQVTTAPAIVIVFANTKPHEKAKAHWDVLLSEGKVSQEYRDAAVKTFLPLYEAEDQPTRILTSSIDASLSAMQFMLVARAHGYDTNPMSGFYQDKAAEMFGLAPETYVPVVGISVGLADTSVPVPEITRYDVDDIVLFDSGKTPTEDTAADASSGASH